MSPASEVFRAWVRDHPQGHEIRVAAAARRGHRLYWGWLVLRAGLAVMLGAILVGGVLQLRSLGVGPVPTSGPQALLVVDPPKGAAPLRVTADASGSSAGPGAEIVSTRFDFGDGTVRGPQSDPVARHSFTPAGTYTVAVTVTDSDGRSDQATATVTVRRPSRLPEASLVVHPDQGPAPLEVVADASDSSAGEGARILRYRFDFGDDSPRKRQQEPVARHRYREPGSYQVSVRVLDSQDRSHTARLKVTVTAGPRPPDAALVVEPEEGPAALEVRADASESSPATGASILAYQFDFDDGNAGEPQSSPEARHTYQKAGEYSVTVTVTDSNRRTSQQSRTVTVTEPQRPARASLVVSPREGPAPLTVTADASGSSPSSGATITDYQFDFGDGFQSGTKYTFQKPGGYTVRVIVTDSEGNTAKDSQDVTVRDVSDPDGDPSDPDSEPPR